MHTRNSKFGGDVIAIFATVKKIEIFFEKWRMAIAAPSPNNEFSLKDMG
jgi:hypothetical protein